MKRVVWKYFSIGDYEKEEQWLNRMAAQGLMLTDVSLCRYVFEEGGPGGYVYRIELLEHRPSHPESARYIRFLEETGAQHVGSFRRWVYLRKKTADGGFELFSDLDSKIRHYKRITRIANAFSAILLCFAAIELMEGYDRYAAYAEWVRRGLFAEAYHVPYIVWCFACIVIAAAAQWLVLPLRKALHCLKRERTIRE
jgi:hypothetical protein